MKNWVRFVVLVQAGMPNSVGEVLANEFCTPIHLGGQFCSRVNGMCPLPEACGNGQGIDSLAFPPDPFIAASVELAVVHPADRNGEPVADLPSHRPLLGKLDVMGV